MSIWAWPSFGLLVQLLLACATWHFHAAARRACGVGERACRARLARASGPRVLREQVLERGAGLRVERLGAARIRRAAARGLRRRSKARPRASGLGLGHPGSRILARPNLVLAVPFTRCWAWSRFSRRDCSPTRLATSRSRAPRSCSAKLRWHRWPRATSPSPDTPTSAPSRRRYVVLRRQQPQVQGGAGTTAGCSAQPRDQSAELGRGALDRSDVVRARPGLGDRRPPRAHRARFDWIAENPGDWVVARAAQAVADHRRPADDARDYELAGPRRGVAAVGASGRHPASRCCSLGRSWAGEEGRSCADADEPASPARARATQHLGARS